MTGQLVTVQPQQVTGLKGWKFGWSSVEPPEIGYAWAPNDGGDYVEREGLLCRELGLEESSGGALSVRRIRVGDRDSASCWRRLDVDFDFMYVLEGAVSIENRFTGTVAFVAGGAALHPRGMQYRLSNFSEDFEAVHITSPARFRLSREQPGGDASDQSGPVATPVYTHDTNDQYIPGKGDRKYFEYRDLGTRKPTESRIHLQVVRAIEPGAATGWHYHSMAQWFMVVGGTSLMRIEDRPRQLLARGDSICVGRGPRMRHNVSDCSDDYKVLEMCVPADYDTIAVREPDGADAA